MFPSEFFKKLKEAGYVIKIKDQDVLIYFENYESHMTLNKIEDILCKVSESEKKTDLNYLVDSDVVTKIIDSITNNPEKWKFIKATFSTKIESNEEIINNQRFKIVADMDSYNKARLKISGTSNDNYLNLSKKEESKIYNLFISFNEGHNDAQLETVNTILSSVKK